MAEFDFHLDQQFPDVNTFRKAVKEAALVQNFELQVVKSDMSRYSAKCAIEGCPWRIRAAKLPDCSNFIIKSLDGTHTCDRNSHNEHPQASVDWIANFIEERLRDDINYKPKDIMLDINKRYGIAIPYKQAWRAKERSLATIYGSSEEGYCLLPSYCEQIKISNPGSIARLTTHGEDSRFQHLFIAFNASIYGFLNGCLPLIGLGAIQLKSKYLGTLLSATSFDAEGGLFLLAFGVVDTETDENWMWFLSGLHKLLKKKTEKIPPLAFLSSGTKGIVDGIKSKFPNASHGICINYLTNEIGQKFRSSAIVNLFRKAANSVNTSGFKKAIAEIKEFSTEAVNWIEGIPPTCWAVAYFEGMRFGYLSSNTSEFNEWILEAPELPIIQIIERIHGKLMADFKERQIRGLSWTSILTPSADKHISEVHALASTYQVIRSDKVEFEVVSADRSDIVNIGTRCCSCCNWQLSGVPCSHGVATLLACGKDISKFTEKYFTVLNYRQTYSQVVYPIPDKLEWSKTSNGPVDEDSKVVQPPMSRRPAGRPEKKRLCIEKIHRQKHTVRCSRCLQTGHYRTTCKAD